MKTSLTFALLALVCYLSCSSAGPQVLEILSDGSCCSGYSNLTIPRRKVKLLQVSPVHCHLRSVVVTTEAQRRFCLDPSRSWTQKLQKEFEKKGRLH